MNNKNIGIITFHWATNYGAVLQAYALQRFLELNGYTVHIINYKPQKYDVSFLRSLRSKSLSSLINKVKTVKKENKLVRFRRKYLNLTKRYFLTSDIDCLNFDCYITGSDQVWNAYFTQYGEENTTKDIVGAYYLSFAPNDSNKISYAVSLGTTDYPKEILKKISPLVKRFNLLTFRESTAVDIINDIDYISSSLVCDPTLLLYDTLTEYMRITDSNVSHSHTFVYILRRGEDEIKKELYKSCNKQIIYSNEESMSEWLGYIYNTKLVITNSYHGMIFSILFKRDFIVVLEEDEPMNDRFFTLLNKLELSNRIIFNTELNKIHSTPGVNWKNVDDKIELFVKSSRRLIINNL